MGREIVISFGTYKGITAEHLFDVDPLYCHWITTKKSFKRNHKKLVAYFRQKVAESPSIFNLETMGFGKYFGLNPDAFIDDQAYCKWLINNKSFLDEYPRMYQDLKELYDVIYPDNICFFYVLSFHGTSFIKIGHTKQSIVRRVYNYLYDYTDYTKYNIDIENSFVYQTTFLEIEKFMLNKLADFRLNKREEKFSLNALPLLKNHIQNIKIQDKYCFHKKPLKDVIPFVDGDTWKENFYIDINNFQNFDNEYIELLKRLDLYGVYSPFHIVDIQHWSFHKPL